MFDSKILNTRDDICTFLKIGKAIFYRLVDQGLPVKKVGRRWYGHREVLEKWFKDFVTTEKNGSSESTTFDRKWQIDEPPMDPIGTPDKLQLTDG